jgi:hypothetical protein
MWLWSDGEVVKSKLLTHVECLMWDSIVHSLDEAKSRQQNL